MSNITKNSKLVIIVIKNLTKNHMEKVIAQLKTITYSNCI